MLSGGGGISIASGPWHRHTYLPEPASVLITTLGAMVTDVRWEAGSLVRKWAWLLPPSGPDWVEQA
jgi:hypothetical protein